MAGLNLTSALSNAFDTSSSSAGGGYGGGNFNSSLGSTGTGGINGMARLGLGNGLSPLNGGIGNLGGGMGNLGGGIGNLGGGMGTLGGGMGNLGGGIGNFGGGMGGDMGSQYGAMANLGMGNAINPMNPMMMSGMSSLPAMGGLGANPMAGGLGGGAFDVMPLTLNPAAGMYGHGGGMDMSSLGMGNMNAMGALMGSGGGSGGGGGLAMSSSADDEEEAVVYQIAYGKPGPLGMELGAHVVQYSIGPSQAVSAYVPVVISGPPGSPMRPGDILLSVNGMSVVASTDESPGGDSYLAVVSGMLASEAPPRIMRFFRYSAVQLGSVGAHPTWLNPRAANIFLDA
jgi:hypothetical protein